MVEKTLSKLTKRLDSSFSFGIDRKHLEFVRFVETMFTSELFELLANEKVKI